MFNFKRPRPAHMLREKTAGWSRKRRFLAGTAGFTIAAVGGAALAILLIRGEFQGNATINARPDIVFDAASQVSQDELVSSCEATLPTTGSPFVNVNLEGIPGGNCTISLTFHKTGGGSIPLTLQDVEYANGTVEASFVDPSHCGRQVDGTPQVTQVMLHIDELAAAPTVVPASATAGLHVVNSASFSPANCPA